MTGGVAVDGTEVGRDVSFIGGGSEMQPARRKSTTTREVQTITGFMTNDFRWSCFTSVGIDQVIYPLLRREAGIHRERLLTLIKIEKQREKNWEMFFKPHRIPVSSPFFGLALTLRSHVAVPS